MQRKQVTKTAPNVKKPSSLPTKAKVPQKVPPPKPPGATSREWKELEKNILILPGLCSQSHKRFKGQNQQGAAVCIVACGIAGLRSANDWVRDVLTNILDIGTNLYLKSRAENRCADIIKPLEIHKYFFLKDIKVSMRVGFNVFSERVARDSVILKRTEDFLNRFFSTQSSGLFVNHPAYFAIWKQDKYYFIFDPSEHTLEGGKWDGLPGMGYCYCVRSTSTKTLANIIVNNCLLKQINKFAIYPCYAEKWVRVNTVPPQTLEEVKPLPLVPVEPPKKPPPKVTKVEKVPKMSVPEAAPPPAPPAVEGEEGQPQAQPVQPPVKIKRSLIPPERPKLTSVTNFVTCADGKMGILRASTHQRDPNFTRYLGAQALGNAIAAVVMLRQYKAKQWIKNILDDVLKLGEVIHHDCKKLQPGEIVKKVTLNEKDYTPKLEKYGAIGRLDSSDDKVLNLAQALRNLLLEHDCCILIGPATVTIWKENNRFYMFDPDPRDGYGRVPFAGQPGVACVTWYLKLADLIGTYMANIPTAQRKSRFVLCRIAVVDYVPMAEDWYNFKALTYNKWILRGNFSQQDKRFSAESRNAQCTANATMALAFKELKQEQEWNSETVDQVLMNGDEFYRGCVEYLQEVGRFKHKYLMVDELRRQFDVENKKIVLEIDDCLVNGIVNAKSDTGIPNLKKGFEQFFLDSDAGIVTANLQSMAIWRKNDTYFYYDSHSRNDKGIVCGYGTACILRLVTIEDLANALMRNLGADPQNLYNISRVAVTMLDIAEGVAKAPLNFFEAVNDLIAILRANSGFHDKKFGINAGKQAVPMCLAALAFNNVTPSFDWNKEDLDEVLASGNKLYEASMEEFYGKELTEEDDDNITTENVKKDLKIGTNLLEMELEDYSSGTVQDNLNDAIQQLAEAPVENFQLVFVSPYITASIWRDENLFYSFDPKPRDEKGCIYGKEEWPLPPPPEEEVVEVENEEQGEQHEEDTEKDPEHEENEIDEMGGGDNLGEPEEEYQPPPEPPAEEEQEVPPQVEELEEQEGEEEGEEEEGEGEEEEAVPVEIKGSEYWRQKEKEEGKSCVLRFGRIEELVQHFIDNTPPLERPTTEYKLKTVKVNNTPVLHEVFDPDEGEIQEDDDITGDWNEFKEVDYGRWILRSGRNFLDGLFPEANRGKQAIPMCIVALAYSSLYHLEKFNQNVIDSVLSYGDRLYSLMRKFRARDLKDNKDLSLQEEEIELILAETKYDAKDYPKSICMGENMAKWQIVQEVVIGDLTSTDTEAVHNLLSGLTKFFEENSFGMLQCREYSVSVWKADDIFYMFDPHPNGPSGAKSPIGVACITRFKELEHLVDVFTKNLPKIGNNFFEIHSLTFEGELCPRKAPEKKEEKLEKVGGFNSVTAGKQILRGDVKLNCTQFDRGVHIHSAPIAFVALALSLNKDPDTWTRMIVNEILTVGEELYNESLRKLGDKFDPWSDRLDVCRVNADFKIGRLKVNTAIRFTVQKGIVDVKMSKVPNLRQGLERFFEENTHGILIAGKFILAVWEQTKGEDASIFLFDPNSRGNTGLPGQGGVACVLKFFNAKLASDHIMSCMMDLDKTKTEYTIVPVEIVVGSTRTKRKVCKMPQEVPKTKDPCVCPPVKSKVKPAPENTRRQICAGTVVVSTQPKTSSKPASCPDKKTVLEQKRILRKAADEERAKKEAKRCNALGRTKMYEINSRESILRGFRPMAPDRELPVNLVAAVFLRIATNLDKWTYKQIEMILEAGNQLYVDSYNTYKPVDRKLALQHVLRRIILKDFEAKIDIKRPILGGSFTRDNLVTHLTNFFNIATLCLVNYEEYIVTVYFKSGYYYLFDPYSRNLAGNRSDDGCAMLMRFAELGDLADKMVKNFTDQNSVIKRYCLIVVGIQSVEPLTA